MYEYRTWFQIAEIAVETVLPWQLICGLMKARGQRLLIGPDWVQEVKKIMVLLPRSRRVWDGGWVNGAPITRKD